MKKLCVLLFPMLLALAYGQVPGAPAPDSATRRVKTVVKDGVVFQVADMDRALGVIPAK